MLIHNHTTSFLYHGPGIQEPQFENSSQAGWKGPGLGMLHPGEVPQSEISAMVCCPSRVWGECLIPMYPWALTYCNWIHEILAFKSHYFSTYYWGAMNYGEMCRLMNLHVLSPHGTSTETREPRWEPEGLCLLCPVTTLLLTSEQPLS